MAESFSTGYQYDKCISRGICSINPTTSSLLEVILLYLKYTVFYELELEKNGIKNPQIRKLLLDVISILSSNHEISEKNFDYIKSAFLSELPKIMNKYDIMCRENGLEAIKKDLGILLKSDIKIAEYIRLGEKEFNKRINELSTIERSLYQILFIIVKSMSINLLTLEDFGVEINNEALKVLEIINLLNMPVKNSDELMEIIVDISKEDCLIMSKIRQEQEKIYGEQNEQSVSFSTVKGNAILVVGSNLKELEQILNSTADKDIDVYTHDNMITSHTFPKFREYKNLKGQYGKGMENCLLDFSTFPGPIVLTKFSLYNVENLYRGRLFSTDFGYSKGVIPIKNNDFSGVITSAKNSKGFKTGKKCDNEQVGVSYEKAVNLITKKIQNPKIKNIILIGSQGYNPEELDYFNSFTKRIPKNTLIISFSGCINRENLICLNLRADVYGILRLSEYIIKNTDKNVSFILPSCDRHTLSIILYLQTIKKSDIYIGKWNKSLLSPNITNCLNAKFGINELTIPKSDLSKMISS